MITPQARRNEIASKTATRLKFLGKYYGLFSQVNRPGSSSLIMCYKDGVRWERLDLTLEASFSAVRSYYYYVSMMARIPKLTIADNIPAFIKHCETKKGGLYSHG